MTRHLHDPAGQHLHFLEEHPEKAAAVKVRGSCLLGGACGQGRRQWPRWEVEEGNGAVEGRGAVMLGWKCGLQARKERKQRKPTCSPEGLF